jgi:hypothetical protein
MSKYARLTYFLQNQKANVVTVTVTFADMEDRNKIGIPLPDLARTHRQWWENQTKLDARQCVAWLEANWTVSAVDLCAERVTFRRH